MRVGVIMMRFGIRAALAVLVLVAAVMETPAQSSRPNEAAQFDFYVLSLSWSPSFCAAAAERSEKSTGSRILERDCTDLLRP
jgi:ribonuclease T2